MRRPPLIVPQDQSVNNLSEHLATRGAQLGDNQQTINSSSLREQTISQHHVGIDSEHEDSRFEVFAAQSQQQQPVERVSESAAQVAQQSALPGASSALVPGESLVRAEQAPSSAKEPLEPKPSKQKSKKKSKKPKE